jgi:hypothetical protein
VPIPHERVRSKIATRGAGGRHPRTSPRRPSRDLRRLQGAWPQPGVLAANPPDSGCRKAQLPRAGNEVLRSQAGLACLRLSERQRRQGRNRARAATPAAVVAAVAGRLRRRRLLPPRAPTLSAGPHPHPPSYLRTLSTRPAPTVLPPSRMAKRCPTSRATGFNSPTDTVVVSRR